FPVLLVHLLRSQLEFLLGSVRNDWRNRWTARLHRCLGQLHLNVFGDERSPGGAAHFNEVGGGCLNVGSTYPHQITPGGHFVESGAPISIGRPHICRASIGRKQFHPQCGRRAVVLLIRDTDPDGAEPAGSTTTHSCRLLCGTCCGEERNRQSLQPEMTRSHNCLHPLLKNSPCERFPHQR